MACQNNVKVLRQTPSKARVYLSFQRIKQSESRERQRDTRTFLHRGFGVLYPASRMYIGAPAHWSAYRTTGHKQGR